MKKSVLALSITAAVAGLAFIGSAQAMTAVSGATANQLVLNGDGIGHMLLVPYYTAQAQNATLVNIVNTDTVNGKAVKVRFRGAANSDDVFDFQVFLSPGDVYAFNVSKNSAGLAQITTKDNSCSKPAKAVLNATPFVTSRLDPNMNAGDKANGTREGYAEIFNMADIRPGTALFTAIKHVKGVAPCSGAAWTNLDSTNMSPAEAVVAGMALPTTGLMSNWIIVNTVDAAAWGRGAVAIQAQTNLGVPAGGNIVYWPQTSAPVTAPAVNAFTADPLLRTSDVVNAASAADATPAVAAAYYDLPDMSTPYVTTFATPLAQAAELTRAIAATAATNEFLTDSSIDASTDWVFSQPTRRYNVSLDYAAISASDDGRRFTTSDAFATAYYSPANTLVTSRQICVKGVTPSVWDREESTLESTTDVVVSPSTPADPLSFCGEASVLSINNGGITAAGTSALKAQVAVKDLDVTYVDGWMTLSTPGLAGKGLPVLGAAYYRADSGPQSFGTAMEHRFSRP